MKKLSVILIVVLICFNSNAQDTLRVPNQYATIQSAINAAVDHDCVLVSERTYFENSDFYNLSGKCIKSVQLENQAPGKHEYSWDTGELPAGIYYVKFRQGDMILTRKLIKQ